MSTYYVTVDGDDANDGLTSATAWKTLAKPSETIFAPGDRIELKCGDIFHGRLRPTYGPITIDCYGDRSLGLPQVRTSLMKDDPADWVIADATRGIWKTSFFDQVHGEPNILFNGNFGYGSAGWAYNVVAPAAMSASVIVDPDLPSNIVYGFYIASAGPYLNSLLFFSTSGFAVERNSVYKISFYA